MLTSKAAFKCSVCSVCIVDKELSCHTLTHHSIKCRIIDLWFYWIHCFVRPFFSLLDFALIYSRVLIEDARAYTSLSWQGCPSYIFFFFFFYVGARKLCSFFFFASYMNFIFVYDVYIIVIKSFNQILMKFWIIQCLENKI